jgi:hypothetical protein
MSRLCYTKTVVAGRGSHDAGSPRSRRELQKPVHRAAKFERAGALQIFQLAINLARGHILFEPRATEERSEKSIRPEIDTRALNVD